MDRLAIVSECRQKDCLARAETARDEGVRSLLLSMAQMWIKLAEEAERRLPSNANGD